MRRRPLDQRRALGRAARRPLRLRPAHRARLGGRRSRPSRPRSSRRVIAARVPHRRCRWGRPAQPEPLFALLVLGVAIAVRAAALRRRRGAARRRRSMLRYEAWASLATVALVFAVEPLVATQARAPRRGRRWPRAGSSSRSPSPASSPGPSCAGPSTASGSASSARPRSSPTTPTQRRRLRPRARPPLLPGRRPRPRHGRGAAARPVRRRAHGPPAGGALRPRPRSRASGSCRSPGSCARRSGSTGTSSASSPLYATFAAQGAAAIADCGARRGARGARSPGGRSRAALAVAAPGGTLPSSSTCGWAFWRGVDRARLARARGPRGVPPRAARLAARLLRRRDARDSERRSIAAASTATGSTIRTRGTSSTDDAQRPRRRLRRHLAPQDARATRGRATSSSPRAPTRRTRPAPGSR